MNQRTAHAPSYRYVAWAYDALASAYSLGAIDRAKQIHQDYIQHGSRVLYAGAGCGNEIAEACRRGAEVTCVEPCPAMASRLHARLSEAADGFTIVPSPVQTISAPPDYDLVVAHFFLNVFDAATVQGVLAHLCGFVKPGGHIVIADFTPKGTSTNPLTRLLRTAYYRPVNLAGWLLRICALHPIYDYEPWLATNGFRVTARKPCPSLPGLPPLYESITAEKQPHQKAGVDRA
ncbi:MAG: methyltransferase domain-containing protein [Phycisphaeraceae bacterium]|nr:methyltransferase domain-containing protein [Phycisphaeraceae bacterium]